MKAYLLWLPAAAVAVAWPWIAADFWVSAVATRVLIIGTTALSLTFLTSMTGMVSFAQAAVAAVAGYAIALLSANTSGVGIVLPLYVSLPLGIIASIVVSVGIGAVSRRSSGIYLLMITLAMSMCWYYFVSQNTTVFNGFDGVNGVKPPVIAGIDTAPRGALYLLCLGAAAVCLALCVYIERTPLGSAFHGLRNAPQRMEAMGYDTTRLRLVAWGIAGLLAAVGGTLNVWYTGQVSPGSTDVHAAVNLLIVAVIGGVRRPAGAFVGALLFVLLENFAMLVISRDRFNLVIGLSFMAVVIFLPGGLMDLPSRLRQLTSWRSGRRRLVVEEIPRVPS